MGISAFLLGWPLGSPIFPSSCEGKLLVALESLQGPRDLTYALPPYCVIISINYLLILVRHFILLCPEVREPKMGSHVRRNLR